MDEDYEIRINGSIADAIEVEERFERAAEAFFDTALQRVRVERRTPRSKIKTCGRFAFPTRK